MFACLFMVDDELNMNKPNRASGHRKEYWEKLVIPGICEICSHVICQQDCSPGETTLAVRGPQNTHFYTVKIQSYKKLMVKYFSPWSHLQTVACVSLCNSAKCIYLLFHTT